VAAGALELVEVDEERENRDSIDSMMPPFVDVAAGAVVAGGAGAWVVSGTAAGTEVVGATTGSWDELLGTDWEI
jgi:hypothetical protein